jgi:trehalose 6-phosphate phosphatase
MIYLFSTTAEKQLEALCRTPTLFALDFDGTLSKIVKEPGKAKIIETTEALIHQLNELGPVAVISGRSLEDLKSKFRSPVTYFVGNHGFEGIANGHGKKESFTDISRRWIKSLEPLLTQNPGVEIEDKTYSLAIHYRKSRQKKIMKGHILKAVQQLDPQPRIVTGKCVINLLPQDSPNKGSAILALRDKAQTKSIFYIGDDDTDEDVFALPDPDLFTIRIGKKGSSRAKYYIHRQTQINFLLKLMLSYLLAARSERRVEVSENH